MGVEIKKAEVSDANLVFNLTKQAFQDYNDPALFPTTPALLETKDDVIHDIKNKEILIAYFNSEPAGSVRYYSFDDEEFYLSRLGVLANYRSQNVGQQLISAVEKRVKLKGGNKVTLYSAYRLKDLLEFYQSLGYEVVGLKEDPDYTRAIITKELYKDSNGEDKEEEDNEIMGR